MPGKRSKTLLGKEGEDLAVDYLLERGYSIIARNYRALHAEIDIVCEHPSNADTTAQELVFVEVKTRTTNTHGNPLEAITQRKLAHVKRAAEHYLYEHDISDKICRFDVIGIQLNVSGKATIEHVKDVVDY